VRPEKTRKKEREERLGRWTGESNPDKDCKENRQPKAGEIVRKSGMKHSQESKHLQVGGKRARGVKPQGEGGELGKAASRKKIRGKKSG